MRSDLRLMCDAKDLLRPGEFFKFHSDRFGNATADPGVNLTEYGSLFSVG